MDRLIKARFQDNFEFLQWLHRFVETNYGGQEYDPVARRGGAAVPAGPSKPAAAAASTAAKKKPAAGGVARKAPAAAASKPAAGAAGGASAAQVNELKAQLTEAKLMVDGLEKERDFYFGKLRDVEVLCQEEQEKGGDVPDIVSKIFAILYQTEEGFEAPEDGDDDTDLASEQLDA